VDAEGDPLSEGPSRSGRADLDPGRGFSGNIAHPRPLGYALPGRWRDLVIPAFANGNTRALSTSGLRLYIVYFLT
jgi:hypothetical protein